MRDIDQDTINKIAIGLGVFSLVLGLAEMLAPEAVGEASGIGPRKGLLRFFGLREAAAGIGLLMGGSIAPWLWARVAGDAVDLAALGTGLTSPGTRKRAVASIAAVAGVTAVDAYCARKSLI